MNIPDEVLAKAAHEALDKPSVSIPALMLYQSSDKWDVLDATEVVRHAAPVIAEWSRREALKEAAAITERQSLREAPNAAGALAFATAAIRALVEGGSDE